MPLNVLFLHIAILRGLLQQGQQTLIVLLERVKLDLQRTVSFTGAVEVLHGLLEVCALFAQAIVLARLHFELLVDVLERRLLHVLLRGEVRVLAITLLNYLLNAIYFHLSDIDLVLVLSNLQLRFLMDFLLGGSYAIQLCSHVLNLACLGTLHVCIAADLHVAFLNFGLCCLVLFCHFSLSLLGLCQLNFYITERVFELLIFYFTKSQHLSVFNFCSLLTLYSESFTSDSIRLRKAVSEA